MYELSEGELRKWGNGRWDQTAVTAGGSINGSSGSGTEPLPNLTYLGDFAPRAAVG
jgi:hypothetical protein